MAKGKFPIESFKGLETPFYFYDIDLLKKTLNIVKDLSKKHGFLLHYAIKANANHKILQIIAAAGFGADCVSGNEIKAALTAGFPSSKIVLAGVGKTDKEINQALDYDIHCFNVESLPELEVINKLAEKKGKIAPVAVRVNPNIDAHTHEYITTGLEENKFGFTMDSVRDAFAKIKSLSNVELIGIHFHIGSQITDIQTFTPLCERVNDLQILCETLGISLKNINVGGGLGIDYENPDEHPFANFEEYFELFYKKLILRKGQVLHFELGRSIIAQCGSLISRVIYIKEGTTKKFAILDAGMTDLIRPALYQAYHKIENISSNLPLQKYDIVGPICESSDTFAKDYELNRTQRGDFIVLRSAGAYGEAMASQYNCRELPKAYFSDKL